MITRRGLLGGFAALLAAPAIVRAASLMPVRLLQPEWGTPFRYYSGYQMLDLGPDTIETAACYQFRQAACQVAMTGLDELPESDGGRDLMRIFGDGPITEFLYYA